MQVLDLVTRALRSIGAYAPGEAIDAEDANDCFDALNDLLDTWSNATMMVPYVTEIVFDLVNNTYHYTIGQGGTIGGSITASSAGYTLTVTAIADGNIALGQFLTGTGVTAGTQIVQFGTGAGETGTYVTNVQQTLTSRTMATYYQRPLRINSAFVRISQLDYPLAILNLENYEQIGFKTLQGPWPTALYYQPSDPVANILFWPVPTSGEMHLFAETVLGRFNNLTQTVTLPQGYAMAIRWNLAELLLPEYGRTTDATLVQLVQKNAADSRAWVKRTNMQPPSFANFDPALVNRNQRANPAWIYSGGFLP
jgi:hypothetical protein